MRSPLTVLTSLVAICGAQALAPTPAAATVNLTEGSGCRHEIGLPPCLDIFGPGVEVISITGRGPICDPTSAESCLPQLIGGSVGAQRQAEEEAGRDRNATPPWKPTRRRTTKPEAMRMAAAERDRTCPGIRISYQNSMDTVAHHRARIAYLSEQADRIAGDSPDDDENREMFAREINRLKGKQREAREVSELAIEDWNERRCGLQSALTAKRGRPPV